MIKCCIFDLDGTILDTITTITYFVNATVERYGVRPITEEECKYFAGNGARLLITRTLESRGIFDKELLEKILKEYNAAYDADPLYLTSPFEKIKDMLASLKERGVKLAVLSNKPNPTVKSIVKSFFPETFDIVLGGREGVPLKPDPFVPREILASFGESEENTAWIGDTATDVETGKNLGARMNIGVLWGFRKKEELVGAGASRVVSTVDELREAISVG